MTVGYRIAGGTDLDSVFVARTSAAAAATGFKDSTATDLNNRYEPRGSATPIANTGYRIAGGTDLSQVFKGIGAVTPSSHTLTAGSWFQATPGITHIGFGIAAVVVTGSSAFGSISPNTYGSNTIVGIWWSDDDVQHVVIQAASTPPDTDATWKTMDIVGTFQGGSSTQTLTLTRNASFSSTGTRRTWQFNSPGLAIADGNIYTVTINRV